MDNTQWAKLEEKLIQYININLKEIIVSNPRNKEGVTKVKVRPILLKKELLYQISSFKGKQVFHENVNEKTLKEQCVKWLQDDFGQLELHHEQGSLICLSNKKGTLTIKEKKIKISENRMQELSHNRKKKYILEENVPVGFLIDLGVQTPQGKIIRTSYDKFRQINRFLEFIEDVLPALENREVIRMWEILSDFCHLSLSA